MDLADLVGEPGETQRPGGQGLVAPGVVAAVGNVQDAAADLGLVSFRGRRADGREPCC